MSKVGKIRSILPITPELRAFLLVSCCLYFWFFPATLLLIHFIVYMRVVTFFLLNRMPFYCCLLYSATVCFLELALNVCWELLPFRISFSLFMSFCSRQQPPQNVPHTQTLTNIIANRKRTRCCRTVVWLRERTNRRKAICTTYTGLLLFNIQNFIVFYV